MAETFELDPPPGIFPDETSFAAKGRWATCTNVRWDNESGRPVVVGPSIDFGAGTLTGGVRAILAWNAGYSSPSNVTRIAYATGGALSVAKLYHATPGTSATDITPASGFTTARYTISLATWGTTLLAAPAHNTLFEWSGSGLATAVTEAPDNIVRMLVSPERRQVLAFGCNEVVSGTFNNRCIRCSTSEDYSGAGSWTPSSSNLSDEIILADTSAIVGAEWVGPYVACWTENALFLGEFVGDPNQTWRFDHVASGCGLFSQRSAAVVGGVVYWMGRDGQFRAWVPGGLPEIIPCPIIREFHENFNLESNSGTLQLKRDKAFLGALHTKGELWWFYNDDRDDLTSTSEPTRYMALNLRHKAWFRGDVARSALFDLGGFYDITGAPLTVVLMGNSSGTVSACEGVSGQYPSWSITTADQYLDSGRRRIMVNRCVPDFEIQGGNVSLTLNCRSYPQGDVTQKGPYTLAAGADKKDFRASGKIISVEFSGSTAAKFGRHTFDYVILGAR